MVANKYTSSNHLYLLPDKSKATFTNLWKEFYLSRKIGESELLSHNASLDKENKFLHRVMIFISLLIQIFLQLISEPLKKFGNVVEDFLNADVSKPTRGSDEYYSVVGLSDTRLELNKDIKQGDANYYPALTMMAAKVAFENEAVVKKAVTQKWKMEFLGFYNFNNDFHHKVRTHAYIFREQNAIEDVIVVAFRGVSLFNADDWSTCFDFSWVKFDKIGKAHLGFMIALGLNKISHEDDDCLGNFLGSWPKEIKQNPKHPLAYYTIREKLKEIVANNPNSKFIVTGHSLGAALAILFPTILALHQEIELLNRLDAIYTYGQPRVGDEEFGKFITKKMGEYNVKYDRIVYGYDTVTKIPFDNVLMAFKHVGRGIQFNGFYQGKVVKEEKQSNEIVILWIFKGIITFVVARLNAVWEIIRGLSIGYLIGPYYREGWFMICLRIVIGTLFPGLINHFPQDYVNSMCLASVDLF